MRMQERNQRLSSVWTKKTKKKDGVADVKQQKTTFRAKSVKSAIWKICEQ